MKKIIKKILLILIIFVIVFEFCFSNTSNAALEVKEETLNAITNLAGGIVSIIFWIPRIIATALTFVLNKTLEAVASTEGKLNNGGDGSNFLTPFDIFFNNYKILGINFFNVNEVSDQESFVYKFRSAVAFWFYAMRTLSSAILLVVLVYVGIRMALSTIAEDKAKYKKMLIDWVCSLALIFVLQYLAIAIIYLNNYIVDALKTILTGASDLNINDMMDTFMSEALAGVGISSMVSTFVFCAITAQSAFFFIAYLSRMIKIGFLIIISPLISITYSIDKMGDGKAQALNNWLKEFAYTILIQPFHCIIYIALIHTAFTLVNEASMSVVELPGILKTAEMNQLANGVLVILCLKFVKDAENVVRSIFGFSDDNSKTSMAAGAFIAGAAVSNARKFGGTARKGIRTASNYTKNLGKAIGIDASKVGSKISSKLESSGVLAHGGDAGKYTGKLGNAANSLTDAMGKLKPPGFLSKGINGAKTLAGKYKGSKAQKFVRGTKSRLRRDTSRALGMMAMAMTYSTGDTDLLSANAYRQAVQEGSSEFFNTSTSTQADLEADNMQALDDAEYNQLGKDISDTENEIERLGFNKGITASEADAISNSYAANNANSKLKAAQDKAKKAQEDYKKAEQAAQMAQDNLNKAEAEKANATSHRARTRAQSKIDNAKKELAKKEQARNDYLKRLNRANDDAENCREEAEKYRKIKSLVAKRDALNVEKENFYTKAAMRARVERRATGPKTSELEKKKNEILQLIMELQKMRRNAGENDSTQVNLLSEDDTDNATRTTDNIVKSVDRSILKGGASIKASDMLIDRTGLDSRAASTLDSIDKAVKEYELLRRRQSIAQTFERHDSYNGDEDKLIDAMTGNLRTSAKKE